MSAGEESLLPRKELVLYRVLGLLGAVTITALGWIHRVVDAATVDPLWERALVVAVCLGAAGLSFVHRTFTFRYVVYGVYYVVTAWVLHLLLLNDLSIDYALSIFIVVPAISVAFHTRRQLAVYLGLVVAGVAGVVLLVRDPAMARISGLLYLTDVAVVCLLLFILVSSRLRTQKRLAESKERYELAARGARDGLWDWDLASDRIYFSARWMGMLGLPEEARDDEDPELWLSRVHPDDRPRLENEIAAARDGDPPHHFECEYRVRHADGEYRWVLSRGVAVRDGEGEAYRMAGSQADITERKRAEEQLVHDAFHDGLTDLPNRALFLDRLGRLLQGSHRRPDLHFAVVYVDLDRFKVVNDSLGHSEGDRLLVKIGRRISGSLREDDTVARLGGDEFGLLLVDLDAPMEASRVVERIRDDLARPFQVGDNEIFVSASMGVALGPEDYEESEALLRDADIAMYRSKKEAPGQFEVFDKAMHDEAVRRLDLERELRSSLDRDGLLLRYQPIISVKDGKLLGFEALLRWPHPERGVLGPEEFLGVAEESGLMGRIGAWVLEEACTTLGRWRAEEDDAFADVSMAVNISPHEILKSDLPANVQELLERSGLPPDRLELEVTEGAVMADPERARDVLRSLRDLGVRVSIDDFGTGYSSLAYLKQFPVSTLKIDRSFVQHLDSSEQDRAMVRSVISLARALGVRALAEGVERQAQLEGLATLECDYAQGFHIAEALDDAAARDFARRRRELDSGLPGAGV